MSATPRIYRFCRTNLQPSSSWETTIRDQDLHEPAAPPGSNYQARSNISLPRPCKPKLSKQKQTEKEPTDLQHWRIVTTAQQRVPHNRHNAGLSGTFPHRRQRSFTYLQIQFGLSAPLPDQKPKPLAKRVAFQFPTGITWHVACCGHCQAADMEGQHHPKSFSVK